MEAAERFIALFLTGEISRPSYLRQATCYVDDHVYWAEQIVESNDATVRFTDIDIGGEMRSSEEDTGKDSEEENDSEQKNDKSVGDDPMSEAESESQDDMDFGFC